jgi:pyruvate/2-oxoglutarate dehydrogenase complex dihydrolipoamide dehydrogenase (E3) component
VIEREQRVLSRVASAQFSQILASRHQARGITIVTSAEVVRLCGRDGRVEGAVLGDGRTLGCDAVLVGVGAAPRDELAVAAGLGWDQGIVDEASRAQFDEVSDEERELLEFTEGVQPGSRLSCQLIVTESCHDIRVTAAGSNS